MTLRITDNELIYMPASLQLELFKAKKLSPVEVLNAQIARFEAVGEKINAVTYTHFDEAMEAARESEKRYMQGDARALEGITVGMKDEHGKAGWIITQGSKLMQNAISGPHAYSPTTIRPKLELPLNYPGIKGKRIAYSPDQSWAQIDKDTARNTGAAVELLREGGATVDEVDLDLGVTAADISVAFAEAALSGPMGEILAQMEAEVDQMTNYARYFVNKAAKGNIGPKDALAYETNIKAANRHLQDQVFLKGYDAIIMPTIATSHIPANHDYTQEKTVINGVDVHSLTGWILTPLFNLLNWYPVVNVPTGLSSQNTPTGMQIIAQAYDDLTAFQVAAAYASATQPLFTGDAFPDFRNEA